MWSQDKEACIRTDVYCAMNKHIVGNSILFTMVPMYCVVYMYYTHIYGQTHAHTNTHTQRIQAVGKY